VVTGRQRQIARLLDLQVLHSGPDRTATSGAQTCNNGITC
jgi:hypothetical protein